MATGRLSRRRLRVRAPSYSLDLASSLRELGDRLTDFLANLEDESASDLSELARLSRSATDQATLLELARTSPHADAWFSDD